MKPEPASDEELVADAIGPALLNAAFAHRTSMRTSSTPRNTERDPQ